MPNWDRLLAAESEATENLFLKAGRSLPLRVLYLGQDRKVIEGFQTAGFHVTSVDQMAEALNMLPGTRPDIFVADLQQIETAEDDFWQQVVAHLGPNRPIILLSSMYRPDIIRRSLPAKMTYVVRKSVDMATLTSLARQAIQQAEWIVAGTPEA